MKSFGELSKNECVAERTFTKLGSIKFWRRKKPTEESTTCSECVLPEQDRMSSPLRCGAFFFLYLKGYNTSVQNQFLKM